MTELHTNAAATLPRRQTWIFAALLAGLVIAQFWPVLVEGRVFAPTDMVFDFAFFKTSAPAEFPAPSNPLLSDAVLKFYPWQIATRVSLEEGRMPWWNPYIYAGAPLFANGESAILYPLNAVGLALPHHAALAFSAVVRVFIAGLGMFLFVRSIGVGATGAALAGIAFTLGGPMTVWLNYPIGNGYAWLPLLFYLTQRLLSTQRLGYSALAGLVITVQILGGHYQTVFIMLLAWGAYGLRWIVRTIHLDRDPRLAIRMAMLLANAAVIGFTLSAVQLVPFRAWLAGTGEASRRAAERLSSWYNPTLVQDAFGTAMTMVIPNLLGNPTLGSMTSFWGANFTEQTTYVGVIALALAAFALAGRVGRASGTPGLNGQADPLAFFSALGAVCLLLAIDAPVVGLINRLPVFNVIAFQRYRIIFVFCAAIAAGVGIDELLRATRSSNRVSRFGQGLALYSAAGLAGLVAIRIVLVHFKEQVTSYNRVRELYPLMVKAFSLSYVPMYFPIVAAVAAATTILCFRRNLLSATTSALLLVTLASVDLLVFGAGYNPSSPAAEIFPETPAARYIRAHIDTSPPERIVATADDLPSNTATPYLLHDVAGSDFVSSRYAEFALRAGGAMVGANRIRFTRFEPRLLGLLGVRYIISSGKPEGFKPGDLRPVFSDGHVTVFENDVRVPRALLSHETVVAAGSREILDLLLSSDFNAATQVVLETEPPKTWRNGRVSPGDRVNVTDYRPGRIACEVMTADPAFVFISDAHDPGWVARVDGLPAKVFRANYAFMAVPVARGSHLVELAYEPPGLRLGGAISAAGVGLTGMTILLGTAAARRRRARSMAAYDRL